MTRPSLDGQPARLQEQEVTMEGGERKPLSALLIDNLLFWALVALIIGLLYGIWATLEILNHYVVVTAPYLPSGFPGR